MGAVRLDIFNIMKNVAGGIFSVFLLLAVGCAGGTVKNVNPEEDSFVIGRVKDRVIFTVREINDMGYYGSEMKIDNFELLNVSSGKTYKIRMNQDGYFVQKIDPGEFVFQLNMSGSGYLKSSRDRGGMSLKTCNVPHKTITNIGTFAVISNKIEGMLLNQIRFEVQPDYGSESFSDPLAWFISKNPDVTDAYGERIVSSK